MIFKFLSISHPRVFSYRSDLKRLFSLRWE